MENDKYINRVKREIWTSIQYVFCCICLMCPRHEDMTEIMYNLLGNIVNTVLIQ